MVTKKPKGLGRGLEALLSPSLSDEANATPTTPAGTVQASTRKPNPFG